MQFKTVRETKNSSYRFVCSVGVDRFFAFSYGVSHATAAEDVEVQADPDVLPFGGDFWPDIQAGVRAGCEEATRRGVRLCCTNLRITHIKFHDVDTTPKAVRACLAECLQEQIVGWAEPIDALRAEWLTSDVVALARGIRADAATDRYPSSRTRCATPGATTSSFKATCNCARTTARAAGWSR